MNLRATRIVRANYLMEVPCTHVVMNATERHLRRKLITLQDGDEVLVDLEKTTKLENHDCLVLEDGRLVQILASDEELLEVRGRDAAHLVQLAWHIGNRHLAAQVEADRILIQHDHVIATMLEQLGARIAHVRAPFSPEHGAYAHGH
jgi:urease accessory protein